MIFARAKPPGFYFISLYVYVTRDFSEFRKLANCANADRVLVMISPGESSIGAPTLGTEPNVLPDDTDESDECSESEYEEEVI